MKVVTSVEIKDGANITRVRLLHGTPTESWRMAIATHIFRFGSWIIDARIRLKTQILNV